MPLLHSQFKGVAQMPDGRVVEVPAGRGLVQCGPCVSVIVHIPDQFAAELARQGKPVPSPVSGIALIDTGAGSTCIDEDVAKRLGLPVIDVVDMASASHASHKANVYPAKLVIPAPPISINAPFCVGAPLAAQSEGMGASVGGQPPQLVALIGRDVLSSFVLIYNGNNGEFTLCV